uniref:Fibrinogen C-terminal domain-containing protein n=1 Tax=Anopheles epiroticus TaxID=199890 RepID=A0A182PVG1_9DIPT
MKLVINMSNINLLFILGLFCTSANVQCDSSSETTNSVNGGFAFEMILTRLKLLEDHVSQKHDKTQRSFADLGCKIENVIQKQQNESEMREKTYRSCSTAPMSSSGVYAIQPEKPFKQPMTVLCDQEYESGGWIVIQHRFDGSTNFYRNWNEYKNGFGNLEGEFWLGLDRIYELTVSAPHELVVVLEDFEGNKTYAKYDQFEIADESQKYAVTHVEKYSGTAGDSFSGTKGFKFSTFDADNDTWGNQCAVTFTGAWWYISPYALNESISNCNYRLFYKHFSNLNGKYLRGVTKEYATGM